MSANVLAAPVAVPLVGAALCVLLARHRQAQRTISIAAVVAALGTAVAVLTQVTDGDILVLRVGDWSPTVGIALVADLMAAMFLVVSLATVLAVLVFAIGQRGTEVDSPVFHPVYLVLVAGVSLAFLTGDLFNLFVAFELILISSYVLLTLGGARAQVTNGMTYVVINLLASTLFITAVGFVYAATGTVDLAELAVRAPELAEGLRLAFGLLLLVVFGIKAAIFPLFFWLPDAYPTAPTSITAIFAGLLTKVGVYAIIRTFTLLELTELGAVVLVAAGLTMIVGVLGAIAQADVKRILSFHIISQIGYMLMGLGLFTVAGLAGSILFIVHQIPVKTALFLVGGLVEQREGTGVLSRIGGLVRTAPVVAVLFAPAALSLAGLPPFSGFVAKLALVEAGTADGAWVIVAVSLVGSALTLLSMTKIWTGVFWGEPDEPMAAAVHPPGRMRLTTAATAGAVALTLAIALFAGVLYEWATVAAEGIADPGNYVGAVLGGGA